VVTSVTSLGRSGLYDWLIQRVSAVIMTAYIIFMVCFLASNPNLQYGQWVELHQGLCMRIFSLFAIVGMAAHAWIGIWSVLTDYVTERLMGCKATPIRLVLQIGLMLLCITYSVWAIDILWGI
jgi:succinate dehydrogenase / fumarate reductase membrane anchor subunit